MPASVRSCSMKTLNPSLIMAWGMPDSLRNLIKGRKLSWTEKIFAYASRSSMGASISDIWVARHSLEPIVPSSHNISASSHPGFANCLIMASVISVSVTVPSKSMDRKKSLFIIRLYYDSNLHAMGKTMIYNDSRLFVQSKCARNVYIICNPQKKQRTVFFGLKHDIIVQLRFVSPLA